MARTVVSYLVPAYVLAVAWLRLEDPRSGGQAIGMLVLALLPALLPTLRLRLAGAIAAGLVAARVALDASPFHERVLGARLKDGILEFYDVRVPFSPVEHVRMDGAVLLGLFAAALVVALSLASRKSFLAVLAVVVGAGWPATLVTDDYGLLLGVGILAAVLWILVTLRAEAPRAALPAAIAGALVVAAAGAAATSGAVVKRSLLDWERWDFYDAPSRPVGVDYVWDSNYDGIRFPDKKTVVLRIRAPERSLYWRATLLEGFDGSRWFQDLDREAGNVNGPLARDPLVPPVPRTTWVRQQVEVVALRDEHLVGAASPVQLRLNDHADVELMRGGVLRKRSGSMLASQGYTIWSAAPEPTARQLAAAPATYPEDVERDLQVEPGVTIRPFGDPTRAEQLGRVLSDPPTENLQVYAPLVRTARQVTAGSTSPYAAVVALESWFRSGGGFTYDEQPPRPEGLPPLVDFVTRTKAGYCQHFAGAMALMLRWLGIPARVAAGFTSGKFQDGTWTVTDHDAHAWVEVWFPRYGWLTFDPTPGRGQLSGTYTFASQFQSVNESIPNAVGKRGEEGTGRPTFAGGGSGGGVASGHPVLRGLAVVLVLLVLGIGLAKLVVRRLRYLARDPRRRAAAARRELADFLRDQRLDVPPSATLADLRLLLERELGIDARAFSAAAGAARYGPPEGVDLAETRTRRELRLLLREVRRKLSLGERARGWLAVRSLRRA
jgi:transglutaminase-like putative cysteine protease